MSAVLDAFRRRLHAASASSLNSSFEVIANLLEDEDNKKAAPLLILELYCNNKISLNPDSHVRVCNEFLSALDASKKTKHMTQYQLATARFLLTVLKCRSKKPIKVPKDININTERLLLSFKTNGMDLMPASWESDYPNGMRLAEFNYIRKLRLFGSMLQHRQSPPLRDIASVALSLLGEAKATTRPYIWHVMLAGEKSDYVRASVDMLSRIKAPNKSSTKYENLLMYTLYLLSRNREQNITGRSSARIPLEETMHFMHLFKGFNDSENKTPHSSHNLSYMFEPIT